MNKTNINEIHEEIKATLTNYLKPVFEDETNAIMEKNIKIDLFVILIDENITDEIVPSDTPFYLDEIKINVDMETFMTIEAFDKEYFEYIAHKLTSKAIAITDGDLKYNQIVFNLDNTLTILIHNKEDEKDNKIMIALPEENEELIIHE